MLDESKLILGSASHLAHLFDKNSKKVRDISLKNEINNQTARTQIYNEIEPYLPDIKKEYLHSSIVDFQTECQKVIGVKILHVHMIEPSNLNDLSITKVNSELSEASVSINTSISIDLGKFSKTLVSVKISSNFTAHITNSNFFDDEKANKINSEDDEINLDISDNDEMKYILTMMTMMIRMLF
ncbi:hypothetical protein Glove_18g58 [Diversispora epigaea]|uniref:Uncharacterized protein n=1 Tax=Diversispora epigaea TaxID=1348612 RepID=A0A397JLB0_9GLOM|nr:hypothetical protein Glove_18g58 [Diversispora epigaea]